ncbi:hypothetical protein PFISCL1PPCAC_9207, partial [Pristionchus fissidentatus]
LCAAPDGTIEEVQFEDARSQLLEMIEREQKWKDRTEEDSARAILKNCLARRFSKKYKEQDEKTEKDEFIDSHQYKTTAELIEALKMVKESALKTFKMFDLFDHVCKLSDHVTKLAKDQEQSLKEPAEENSVEKSALDEDSVKPIEGNLSDYISEML